MCFSSHLHASARWESVREAEPDAASGSLPWPRARLFSSRLGRPLHLLPEGPSQQMTSCSRLWQSRGLLWPRSLQRQGEAGQGPKRRDLVPPSLIPNGSVF